MSDFDYERGLWGLEPLAPGERSIAGFRLEQALACLPARGRVMELGCGGGRYLRALAAARPELELVGIDVSRSALARLAAAAPGIETRPVEAGAALPAADGEFDAVLAIDVLEHVEDPDATLAEVARVLVPGGRFHLHVPCEGDVLAPWRWIPGQRGERGLKRRLGGHLHAFRRAELLARFRRAGFQVERVRNSLHLLGALADVAAFAALARAERRGRARTTGDLVAGSREPSAGGLGAAVRAVDAALWCEARLLARVPSWSLHITGRLPARAADRRAG